MEEEEREEDEFKNEDDMADSSSVKASYDPPGTLLASNSPS